jgi:hypothetical protein
MGAVLPAVALYILVSVFSEGLESSVRWKILVIAIVSSLMSAAVQALIGGIVGTLVGFAAALLLIFVTLNFWCPVDRKATLKIVAAYAVFTVALAAVIGFLRGAVASS